MDPPVQCWMCCMVQRFSCFQRVWPKLFCYPDFLGWFWIIECLGFGAFRCQQRNTVSGLRVTTSDVYWKWCEILPLPLPTLLRRPQVFLAGAHKPQHRLIRIPNNYSTWFALGYQPAFRVKSFLTVHFPWSFWMPLGTWSHGATESELRRPQLIPFRSGWDQRVSIRSLADFDLTALLCSKCSTRKSLWQCILHRWCHHASLNSFKDFSSPCRNWGSWTTCCSFLMFCDRWSRKSFWLLQPAVQTEECWCDLYLHQALQQFARRKRADSQGQSFGHCCFQTYALLSECCMHLRIPATTQCFKVL